MQAWKGNPKPNHEATSEANCVEECSEEAYSKADRGRGKDPRWSRNNPRKNRASVEALPKISSAASANPMRNRASAEALPKFFFPSAAATNPTKNRAHTEALLKIFLSSLASANPTKNRANAEALSKFSFSSVAATNPTKNRANAEALPKFSFSSVASTKPMKNRTNAEALPKFPSAASAGSSEGGEPLNNAGMAELGQNMSRRGTTAAQFAQKAQKEEAAPGWKGNGKGNPKSNHYGSFKADRVKNAANHPAYWGGGTCGRSWDDDSQDTPPAHAQKEDSLDDKDEDGPADGKDRAQDIVAAALTELAWEEGGLPALNIVRLDHGYDVRAGALAALRDNKPGMPSKGSDRGNSFNNSNVDPDDPYGSGGGSSLGSKESKGSDLGNSFDNSNVDPDNPYGGGCGSSLNSEEADARNYQDPMDYSGGGSDLS
jgi:hypothetical protein